MRWTYNLVTVALTLAAKPLDERWAYEVAERGGLSHVVTTEVMARMRRHRWLVVVRKEPGIAGKPRAIVRITTKGIVELRKVREFAAGKRLYAQWMPPDGALDITLDGVPDPAQPDADPDPFPESVVLTGLAIAHAPDDEHWAADLARQTGLTPHGAARALSIMAADGWLTHGREGKRVGLGRGNCRRLHKVTRRKGLAGLRRLCRFAANHPEYRALVPAVLPGVPDEGPGNDREDKARAAIPKQERRTYIDTEPTPMPELAAPLRGNCRECGIGRTLRSDDGTMPAHSYEGARCDGSRLLPADEPADEPAGNNPRR